jgi:hypothetical protein
MRLTAAHSPQPTQTRIYELYSDYVLKNPFYEVEQVIKCELFDTAVDLAVRRYPLMLLTQPAGQGQLLAAGPMGA